jgi:hypothetical protein
MSQSFLGATLTAAEEPGVWRGPDYQEGELISTSQKSH